MDSFNDSDKDSCRSSSSVASSSSRPSSSGKSPRFLTLKPCSSLVFFPPSESKTGNDLYDDPDFKKLLQTGKMQLEDEKEVEISADDIITGSQLGSGQYGQVFKCHVNKFPQFSLAYKSIRLDPEPRKKKLILAELEATRKVKNHAYAVQTFCAITFETNLWFIMELMDFSLNDLIKERNKYEGEKGTGNEVTVPESVVRLVAYACVQCLSYLSSLKIIHRDVKPANILIRWGTGEVKVGDFGISGRLMNSMAHTEIFQIHYVSPERLQIDAPPSNNSRSNRASIPDSAETSHSTPSADKRRTYTVKNDIWAVGVTCYEFVTGRNPFNVQDRLFDTLTRIREYDPPELSSLPNIEASQDLSSFVASCLIKDPEERPKYSQLKQTPFFNSFNEDTDPQSLTEYCRKFRICSS